MSAPNTPVSACPRPYLKHPEGVQSTKTLSASQQTASTAHKFVKHPQNYRPRVIRVFEPSKNGIKYVMLDNGHWYKLKYASKVRQLNGQQHAKAAGLSNTLEDYTREVKKVLAKLNEMEKQVTKILSLPEGNEDGKGQVNENGKGGIEGKRGIKCEDTKKGSSRRKRPQEMKWHEYRFVARNGLLSTWGKHDERRGHRLRHRCTWIPVPEERPIEQLSGNLDVPGLVLTSAEGNNFSLHDPAELLLRD